MICCMTYFFSLLFWGTGIALLVFGTWMKTSLHQYLELSEGYDSAVSNILIVTGSIIFLVGFYAFSCPVNVQGVSILLAVLLILELIVGFYSYIYFGRIEQGYRNGLNSSLHHYGYGRIQDKDLDLLQSSLHCCGVYSYIDWYDVWQNESVPFSCCKDTKECHSAPVTNTSDIYVQGCYKGVTDLMKTNLGTIGSGIFQLTPFPLIGLVLICCLGKHINRANYVPME